MEKTFNQERYGDRHFADRTRGGTNVAGFLYDLGHNGRGLDDFPYQIQIVTSSATPVKIPWSEDPGLQVDMPFSELLTQFTEQIRDFVETHEFRRRDPNAFQNEVSALSALAEQVRGRTASLKLSQGWGGGYEVESIEVLRSR